MAARQALVLSAVLLSIGLAGCPGPIQPRTQTVDPSTASIALVDQALSSGSNRLVLAISGSDEAPRSVRPPSEHDCRTSHRVTSLVISHL